ncbi:ABC transporter permease [Amycolatopsis sp. GM8]|uniref:ABC transporter permease n=1 Tax=Amycolatopsis sp. GM8 TaxID=2896530 RepID=UPI001F23311D|nr:ABC transporter permease [Amycolatopsis sp. GM8]
MLWNLARRTGIFVATLLASSIVVFGLMAVLPGDPARVALGLNATDSDVAHLREQFGLDQSLPERYLDWLRGLITLHPGTSYVTQTAIGPEIATRIPVTLILVGASMLVAIAVAIPLGTVMALRHRRASGLALSALSQVGVAVPTFLAGILLVTLFAVRLGWLPSSGWTSPQDDFEMFARQLVLPALALGLCQGAIIARYVRSSILDVLRQDYIRTARAKGRQPAQALIHHGLRNAAVPVVTALALQLVYLLLGAVVIERVFVIPGIGSLLTDSVGLRDLNVVQDVVMLLVAAVLVINLVVDILYVIIDPRLRAAS